MKTNTVNLMKRSTLTLAAALAAVAVTGCYNPNGTPDNTATGALAGGAFGAATGAIIGSASHSAGEGAWIGAAAGTVLGALIGHSADQAQEARLREQAPATYARAVQGTPLSLADVKALSKAGLSDTTIIAQIANSHTVYHVSATDIIDLHENGVSQAVIDYIVNTPTTITPGATAVVVAGPPPPAPVEVITPMPGPGYVWTNGEWVWNGGWYWSAGYWAFPPYPGAIWIGGYWGPGPHGYIRYGGHWGRR
ncbi:MAG: YMGG-like glycine zipper-containing protein [Verrucomicrobiota bacterium]